MPGKPREGLLDLWENQIIPDMIQVHESDIASVMVDTGTILWEIDHQAHLERVQKEALAREKKPRESLIQIEYARPNKEIRAIYQMARATGKNLVSVNHLGAKYGVGLVEERRGGRSEKVMKSDVVIGESWRGFSQLGQIVDLVLRTRLEYNCTKCQMWIPVAPNNTVPIEIEAVHGKCKSYINMTPTPTGEIEECGYVLDAQGLKLPNPNYDSVKLSIRAMMGAL